MSSLGIVRILALLQRKTLIETKNRTLKCLKWQYSTVRSMKNVAVLTAFSVPTPGGFDSSRVPTPMLMPGGQPGGGGRWAQLELTDALIIWKYASYD